MGRRTKKTVPRSVTSLGRVLIDVVVLIAAFGLAFLVRFDGQLPPQMFKRLVFLLPYVVALQYGCLMVAGVHRFAWRYMSLRECGPIIKALLAPAILFVAVRIASGAVVDVYAAAQYALVPFSIIVINFGVACLGIAGVRVLRRIWGDRLARNERLAERGEPLVTILIGAGDAGALVASEINDRPDLGMSVVGFLDDDEAKHGQVIHGIPVVGATDSLGRQCARLGVEQAIITIATASGEDIRRLVSLCDEADVPARIIPGIAEILDGRVNLSLIRDVSIEDLLGREPIDLEAELVGPFLASRRVMVTGAGGSIGSELCRQVANLRPSRLFLVERAEPLLFNVHRELTRSYPTLEIVPLICDVTDQQRVDKIMAAHQPDVIFHAAAHKHVPMMERNPGEAVKNNVLGTRVVADAADAHGVGAFVLISTDKAVNPSSIMGATKRVAELYLQALSRRSKTRYVAVRFGNVLGSTGSVIPIFKEQIERGGPVTVTHPDMVRYFMTIPEASQLVLQAGAMGEGGEIFVLDMGTPVKIVDLARDLIRLSGLVPNEDIAIEFVGVRPGEKLFEELGFDGEKMDRTRHNKIFVGKLVSPLEDTIVEGISRLRRLCEDGDPAVVRSALRELVPEMVTGAEDANRPRESGDVVRPEAISKPASASQLA